MPILNSKFTHTVDAGWTLAKRSISIQIRDHLLGYAWVLIVPMLYAVCYVFIKRELMGSTDHEGIDTLRAFCGIMLLQFWMQIVQSMSELVQKQKSMLRGLNISSTPFVLAVIFEGAVALLIRALLIIIASQFLSIELPKDFIAWLSLAGCLAALFSTSTAIGLLLAPWSTLYADVRKSLSTITLPMLLISPVFYPAVSNTDSWLYWLNCFNPVASPFAVISSVFQSAELSLYILPMVIWTCLASVLAVWSIFKLKKQVPVLLERIGN